MKQLEFDDLPTVDKLSKHYARREVLFGPLDKLRQLANQPQDTPDRQPQENEEETPPKIEDDFDEKIAKSSHELERALVEDTDQTISPIAERIFRKVNITETSRRDFLRQIFRISAVGVNIYLQSSIFGKLYEYWQWLTKKEEKISIPQVENSTEKEKPIPAPWSIRYVKSPRTGSDDRYDDLSIELLRQQAWENQQKGKLAFNLISSDRDETNRPYLSEIIPDGQTKVFLSQEDNTDTETFQTYNDLESEKLLLDSLCHVLASQSDHSLLFISAHGDVLGSIYFPKAISSSRLAGILDKAAQKTGNSQVDLMVFDSCTAASLSIAFAISQCSHFKAKKIISSERTNIMQFYDTDSWENQKKYRSSFELPTVAELLRKKPEASVEEIEKLLLETAGYENSIRSQRIEETFSSIEVEKITKVQNCLQNVSQNLLEIVGHQPTLLPELKRARWLSATINNPHLVDLFDFTKQIKLVFSFLSHLKTKDRQKLFQELEYLQTAILAAIPTDKNRSVRSGRLHGLNLHWPTTSIHFKKHSRTTQEIFGADSSFLQLLEAMTRGEDGVDVKVLGQDSDTESPAVVFKNINSGEIQKNLDQDGVYNLQIPAGYEIASITEYLGNFGTQSQYEHLPSVFGGIQEVKIEAHRYFGHRLYLDGKLVENQQPIQDPVRQVLPGILEQYVPDMPGYSNIESIPTPASHYTINLRRLDK